MKPKMLASVRTPAEVMTALANGADIIDLKDPLAGALGALPYPLVQDCLRAVAKRVPVSATIGDHVAVSEIVERADALFKLGVDFVKLADDHYPRAHLLQSLRKLPARRVVLVYFADQTTTAPTLPDYPLAGVMLDTYKKSRNLLECCDVQSLRHFIGSAHQAELFCGLAGSLRCADIPVLAALHPDYLGFRGALCAGAARENQLCPQACARVRAALNSAMLQSHTVPSAKAA